MPGLRSQSTVYARNVRLGDIVYFGTVNDPWEVVVAIELLEDGKILLRSMNRRCVVRPPWSRMAVRLPRSGI